MMIQGLLCMHACHAMPFRQRSPWPIPIRRPDPILSARSGRLYNLLLRRFGPHGPEEIHHLGVHDEQDTTTGT